MLTFHKENTDLLNNKCQGILPTTRLSSLVIHNSSVSNVCDIYSRHWMSSSSFTFVAMFYTTKHDQNIQYLC